MSTVDRKAAIAEYKKRKALAGIFAVRCLASGQVWVGRAPDIDSIETRLRFGLRSGGHRHPAMQAAWNANGGDSFAFEIIESVEEELAYVRDSILKGRLAHWREALGAELA
jgi:hypothetical protein